MVTITQLEYLVSVYNYGHFGRAARACHISQPTLSMQLKKLEEEIGLILLDRSRQPITPTPEGEAFIAQAKAILHEMSKLNFMAMAQGEGLCGALSVALIPTLSPYLVPRFLPSFAAHYPKVTLAIQELTTGEAIRALEERALDVAILASQPQETTLTTTPLFVERFMIVLHADDPLAHHSTLSIDHIRQKPIWLLEEGHCLREQTIALCKKSDRPSVLPNVHFESGNLQTLVSLVAMGEGITLIPEMASESIMHAGVVIRPFRSPAPAREVVLVHHANTYKQSIIATMIDHIQQSVHGLLGSASSRSIDVIR